MLAMDTIIPISMIIWGKKFFKNPPKINTVSGYRTNMSMKNKETWGFAHKYYGRLWYTLGWILIPISIIPMFFVVFKNSNVVGIAGGIICTIQLVFLFISIPFTESALRKVFDKNGHKR